MRYLGLTPRKEHGFEMDEEKRRNALNGREIAEWCEERFGRPDHYAAKYGFISYLKEHDPERSNDYWYHDKCFGEKTIGMFYFSNEDHAFEFRLRWC